MKKNMRLLLTNILCVFLVKLALTDTNEANVLLSHKAIAVAAAAAAAARRTLEPRLNKDLKQN